MPSTGMRPRAESWNVTRALDAYYAVVRFNKLATKGRRYNPDPRCEFSTFGDTPTQTAEAPAGADRICRKMA